MSKPEKIISALQIIPAVKEAGAAILQHLTSDLQVDLKKDSSPVTRADKAADAIIKNYLSKITPAIPILSEEDSPETQTRARASRIRWLVDPLDGTRTAIDYANGHKDYFGFGVHVGLVESGSPILGVAYFPATGVTYFTGDDGSAYKQTGEGVPEKIFVSSLPFKEGLMRAAVHYHEKLRPEMIGGQSYSPVPGVGGQRLCLVAEGEADVANMYDIPLSSNGERAYKVWDFAAAHAVLKAAGGELVSTETGQSLTYDFEDNMLPGAIGGGLEVLRFLGYVK